LIIEDDPYFFLQEGHYSAPHLRNQTQSVMDPEPWIATLAPSFIKYVLTWIHTWLLAQLKFPLLLDLTTKGEWFVWTRFLRWVRLLFTTQFTKHDLPRQLPPDLVLDSSHAIRCLLKGCSELQRFQVKHLVDSGRYILPSIQLGAPIWTCALVHSHWSPNSWPKNGGLTSTFDGCKVHSTFFLPYVECADSVKGLQNQYTRRRDLLIDAMSSTFHLSEEVSDSSFLNGTSVLVARERRNDTFRAEKYYGSNDTSWFSFVPPTSGMFVWVSTAFPHRYHLLWSTNGNLRWKFIYTIIQLTELRTRPKPLKKGYGWTC